MRKPVIITFLVVMVISVTFSGCKKKGEYFINGIWLLRTTIYSEEFPADRIIVFSGDNITGIVKWVNGGPVGTYSVDGENVDFDISYTITSAGVEIREEYRGIFVDDFYMRGGATTNGIDAGAWNAEKL